MPILAFCLYCVKTKEKNTVTKCYPSGIEPGPLIASDSKSNTLLSTLTCKTETLDSLYSHALLILTKSSKSKHQVVHEQNFKDLLSSTCQVSVERIVLDLESEAMRDLGSIPAGGNILSFLCVCEKPDCPRTEQSNESERSVVWIGKMYSRKHTQYQPSRVR